MRRELASGYEPDDARDLMWFLNTRHADGLYTRFGFEAPTERTRVRPRCE